MELELEHPEFLPRPSDTVRMTSANAIAAQGNFQANNVNINMSVNDPGLSCPHNEDLQFCSSDFPVSYFSGRKEILGQIHNTFLRIHKESAEHSTWEERVVLLYGLGGMGKTEIARKYAEKYMAHSAIQNVVFFNVKSQLDLVKCFKEFAENDLHLKVKKGEWIPTKVYKHIAVKEVQSLFIFDDAQQMQSDVSVSPFTSNTKKTGLLPFLPTQLFPNRKFLPWIIITSRNNEWQIPGAAKIYIGELRREEALAFVTLQLKKLEGRDLDKSETTALTNLVILLQGFPLALSIAVTRIFENTRLPNLTERIEAYIRGMSEPNGSWIDYAHSCHPTTMYKLTIRDIWEKTISNLEGAKNGGDAVKLLDVMVYLRSADVTVKIREKMLNFLTTLENGSINAGLIVLHQNAIVLLERIENPGYNNEFDTWIRIHRLVRRCRRDELDRMNSFY